MNLLIKYACKLHNSKSLNLVANKFFKINDGVDLLAVEILSALYNIINVQ